MGVVPELVSGLQTFHPAFEIDEVSLIFQMCGNSFFGSSNVSLAM